MCTGGVPADHDIRVMHDFEPAVQIALEPVDAVTVTTLMDNVTDVLMPDQGPATRPGPKGTPRSPASTRRAGPPLPRS